uniref:ARAD1D28512p n=1 Tax=Blastobotrys adeninivorans TaxID=409370 RepID=A0A060TAQ3_BLAAD
MEDPNCPRTQPRGSPAINITCGPLLRYCGMRDTRPDAWRGTVLIVTRDQDSSYERTPYLSLEFGGQSGNTNELEATKLHEDHGYTFWRFTLDLTLTQAPQQVAYCVNGDTERSHAFHLPSLNDSMNVMFYSCNGFSLGVDATEFKSQLWSDVLEHHKEAPFHVMLGGGDQLYCDSISSTVPAVAQWANEKNPIKKNRMKVTPDVQDQLEKYYLGHYMAWYGVGFWKGAKAFTIQKHLPLAMARIPMINIFDDHDIIDGFGSYPDHTMRVPMFSAIGNTAFKYYMLFQNQTLPGESFNDPIWVSTPKPGPYITEKPRSMYARLGSQVAFYGLDCRTERTHSQIVAPDSYNAMFKRLEEEIQASKGEIQHVLVMLGVPFAYPRMVWLETLLSSRAMAPFKVLAKHGLMSGLTNDFDGRIELLDDLDDHWCAKHHKKERNHFVQRLLDFGKKNSVRITVLAGDVHLAGIGRFYSKSLLEPTKDPNFMLNVISSAIVNTPPPVKMADFLNKRNKVHHFSHTVDEDMVQVFTHDVDGSERNNQRLMPRRNWCSIHLRGHQATNTARLPGPANRGQELAAPSQTKTKDDLAYWDSPDSLSVVIHVEKDQMSTSNTTEPYEILVPKLSV